MNTIMLSGSATVLILVGAAFGQSGSNPEIAPKTPEGWIVVRDKDYIPVIDGVSRRMQSARKAFMMKDPGAAATDVRATAELLSKQTGVLLRNWRKTSTWP